MKSPTVNQWTILQWSRRLIVGHFQPARTLPVPGLHSEAGSASLTATIFSVGYQIQPQQKKRAREDDVMAPGHVILLSATPERQHSFCWNVSTGNLSGGGGGGREYTGTAFSFNSPSLNSQIAAGLNAEQDWIAVFKTLSPEVQSAMGPLSAVLSVFSSTQVATLQLNFYTGITHS